jgi:hypothetical protein
MALMRNEGRTEYEDNERGIAWIEERKRMMTTCQERKVLSSCLLSILQALELGHSPKTPQTYIVFCTSLPGQMPGGLISLINLSFSATGELLVSKLGNSH